MLISIRKLKQLIREATVRRVPVVVDVAATSAARQKHSMHPDMIVGRFDADVTLYRIFDEQEFQHIKQSGRITGGSYAVKAEREFGASWGSDISQVINWGLRQRGTRLGNKLYLARLPAYDMTFAHLDPEVAIDLNDKKEQIVYIDISRCNVGLGCSVSNVSIDDVELFHVKDDGQLSKIS